MKKPTSHRKTTVTGGGRFIPPTIEELDAVLTHYEFIDMIGQGGMGAVYKARQPGLDRLVAIKILPTTLDEPEMHFSERFKREAKAMARLSHSNIVSVYDFGVTADAQFYIVMEFTEGTELHKLIRSRQVTQEKVLQWAPQICSALAYAHSKGLIHRDIKPANILIDEEEQVKVVDFGLAKFTGDANQTQLTKTNVTMGSPDYFAPECLQDDVELDGRADLYAVGVLIYEMLTGTVPRGAWQAPSAINPDIDERFDDLVVEAMDPNRDTRIQTAEEIGSRLVEIRNDPGVDADHRKINLMTGPVPIRKPSRHTTAIAPGSGARPKRSMVTGPVPVRQETAPVEPESGEISQRPPSSGMVKPAPRSAPHPLPIFLGVFAAAAIIGTLLYVFSR
ncbi:MAG: serine/threonine protein kinase [Verrucomicrobiales bacterium]|nr:serine/threonine protein kinase [Verrucomicrobiales bacterium]